MSPHPAVWRNGTCTGSLWKSHTRHVASAPESDASSSGAPRPNATDSTTFSLDGILAEVNERQRTHEFCVLVGNTLWSYSDVWAYAKGDPPTSEIRIVGASAWNPPSVRNPSTGRKAAPASSQSGPKEASLASETMSSPSKSVDFLIVTYSGTHVQCAAPTPSDRDEWLEALHVGLEGNIMENRVETLVILSKKHDERATQHSHQSGDNGDTRKSCRDLRSSTAVKKMAQSAIASAREAFEAQTSFSPLVPPLPRGSSGRKAAYYEGASLTASCHPTGYHSPCDDKSGPLSETHCTACGRYPPDRAMRIDAAPLPEYGMEVRVDLCHDCWLAQGVLQHVRYLGWLYEVEARDRAAICQAWDDVKEEVERLQWENAGLESAEKGNGKGKVNVIENGLSQALFDLIGTENFLAYRQRSNTLDSLCKVFERHGADGASDFLESIEECAQAAESSCFYGKGADSVGNEDVRPKEEICLKKEAFKVAGDMSAALKLLYEYALPPERRHLPPESYAYCSHSRNNADMLAAILEFFLDLCDEGELDAVAFFWPQLCHIHVQMLPPRDAEELVRVELMEDFLLTVATRYSVHLALDLVWGLTADLEESLGASSGNSQSRRRRFAIIRFVTELESLLFDFEGGWGGGGVSLQGMLSPSQHQATLLRDSFSLLQLWRRFGSHYLTRSVRLDKIRSEALDSLGIHALTSDVADAKAQIARNAVYFSQHISFARRLGDIAEKLRFLGIESRPKALQEGLKEINASSGKVLGGDPLNRVCGDGLFLRTVRIPVNEGHVFRSKERTPVLLLAEVVKDSGTALEVDDTFTTAKEPDEEGVKTAEEVRPAEEVRRAEGADTSEKMNDVTSSGKEEKQTVLWDEPLTDVRLEPPLTPRASLADGRGRHLSEECPVTQSPGRLSHGRTLSHGVLSLTPRATEANHVTEEEKGKMADMIATLVDHEKIKNLAPPPLDLTQPMLDDASAENDAISGEPKQLPDPPEEGGDNGRNMQSEPPSRGLEQLSVSSRKMSALGSVFQHSGQSDSSNFAKSSGIHLTADKQFRRDVLFAIMERGMRGSNVIAKGAATAARRAIQTMDRKRAIALMNESAAKLYAEDHPQGDSPGTSKQPSNRDITINAEIDEDEVMEALRLLIIQNQAAQENLSPENAAKMNGTGAPGAVSEKAGRGVDAGEVDQRLAGCGQISSSVLSALRLWKGGIVSNGELLELVQKDLQFLKQSAVFGSADERKLIEDSAFWGRFSFGERWAEKKARLAASSPHGSLPGWDLVGCIVKSNDDLRQEAFVMQLIGLCQEAFDTAGLDLWVHPYEIVATGLTTGIIECVRNAMSFDSLKKRPGYGTDGLVGHFKRMTEIAADPFKALNEAKENFVSSLAAYSLMSYLFLFKDRHNGNLLLDTAGHVIHIDFGFVFGIAPGGSFSLEQSTPFKLTEEMLEVMGGLGSPLFSEFVTLFCCGFLALQAHADTFLTVVEVTCRGSNYPCFEGKEPDEVVSKLRERFCPELDKSQTVAYALDLIKFATTSYGTAQYDYFQYLSQGIAT